MYYFQDIFAILLFINLIVFPLLLLKYYPAQTQLLTPELIHSFPEALYLWTPNHYFNLFLQERYPHLVNYRPFIADILRYDFQIEEALANSITGSSYSKHSSTEALTQNSHTNLDKGMKHIFSLVRYIERRFLKEESEQFCGFDEEPEVRESIREKYSALEENLD